MRAKRMAALPLLVTTVLLAGSACAGAAPAEPMPTLEPATPTPTDPVAAWVDERMSQLTIEQKAASLLMLHAPGTDPAGAAERVAAAVSGEHGAVLSTLKHFPGHGAAPGDSHSTVPTAPLMLDEWRAGHPVRCGHRRRHRARDDRPPGLPERRPGAGVVVARVAPDPAGGARLRRGRRHRRHAHAAAQRAAQVRRCG